MASLLRAHGLTLEGGVLAKPQGVANKWNTHALIKVIDQTRFKLSVDLLNKVKEASEEHFDYLIGIVPKDCRLANTDIDEKTGIFVRIADSEPRDEVVWIVAKYGTIIEGNQCEAAAGRTVEFFYMDDCIFLAYGGGTRVKIVEQIPRGDYVPCISVLSSGQRLRVSVAMPARKRPGPQSSAESELPWSLWNDRTFPDAFVVCGERKIAVHRCVLSSTSPFFAKAFQSEMREGKEACISIDDANPDAVEALLQFLYTKSVSDEADVSDLLPLAHRLECRQLVDDCASKIIEGLAADNVVKFVKSLRPFADDPSLQKYWMEVGHRISADPALVLAMMRS